MSRTTLRQKVEEGAQEMKRNIKQAMSSIEFIATDCWSARRRGFLGVTAHWVDSDSLKRCSVALASHQSPANGSSASDDDDFFSSMKKTHGQESFKRLGIKGPHTFDVLGSALNDIHCEFGIEKKIVRTTTDNGSNFIKAFREYGEQQQDENNNCASSETEEDACSDDDEQEEEGVDVDFIELMQPRPIPMTPIKDCHDQLLRNAVAYGTRHLDPPLLQTS
nr:uncharacterized protein LOC111841232 [Paramormyrops kingsleyae]